MSKRCRKCQRVLSDDSFTTNNEHADGLASRCRDCQAVYRDSVRVRRNETGRWWHIKKHYGLSQSAYKIMFAGQVGRCAICHDPLEKTGKLKWACAVDHDHKTGKVRGLLCHYCNLGLGSFKDSITSLQAAVEYLRANRTT